MQSASYE